MRKKKQVRPPRKSKTVQVAYEDVLVNLRVDTAISLRVPMGTPDAVVTAAVETCWDGSNLVIPTSQLAAPAWIVQKSENLEHSAIVCLADPAVARLAPRDAKAVRIFWSEVEAMLTENQELDAFLKEVAA